MRILVVGAGAVGGYYGARLVEAGRDVTFLLRERRAKQVREHGLRVQSPRGDATVQPRIVLAEELHSAGGFDLILVSTKAYALRQAMEDFAPAVGAQTLILPLLNGMAHMDALDNRFSKKRVLGGSVRILADVLPDGTIEQMTRLGEMTSGFRPGTPAERANAVREALTVAGFELIASPDVIGAMWQKWWLLAAMGAVCVLADGSLGDARRTPEGAVFNRAVLEECMAVAAANGYPPRAELVAEMRERFDDSASTMTSSMYRDMKRGGEVEAEEIVGDLIRRAKDVSVPLLRAAYVRLKVYEEQRVGESASQQVS